MTQNLVASEAHSLLPAVVTTSVDGRRDGGKRRTTADIDGSGMDSGMLTQSARDEGSFRSAGRTGASVLAALLGTGLASPAGAMTSKMQIYENKQLPESVLHVMFTELVELHVVVLAPEILRTSARSMFQLDWTVFVSSRVHCEPGSSSQRAGYWIQWPRPPVLK